MANHVERRVRQILGTAVIARDPIRFRGELAAASKKAVDEFLDLAKKQGLVCGVTNAGEAYVTISDALSITLHPSAHEVVLLQRGWSGQSGKRISVPLAFDCVSQTLVGVDVDDEIAPTPGELLPRLPAAVAIARAAADLFTTDDGTSR